MAVLEREITIRKLGPACGAEITGVDLTKPLSAGAVREIQQAWNENLVLLFRGQTLGQEDQLRFAANFGELGNRKQAPDQLRTRTEGVLQLDPRVLLVSNMKENGVPVGAFGDGDMWFHIDSGYSARPYRYTFLYGVKLPSEGGNTRFSNMYKAYDAVPGRLKTLLTGKRALHVHEYKRNEKIDGDTDVTNIPHAYHPIFITHPRTGRKSLFVDRLMTARLEGFSLAESDEILAELYEIGEREEFIYEHVWQLGDFIMWDNLATIHARTYFPKDQSRMLRRCTIEGEPVHE
ncbi:MAG TPA: TauD/TfdA family dioxygenase [Stellaceae bacterium]|jgi:taurine dioxygenase|nr:TauD/TfdA family dioxygenase [Stellaceae bacterium]